MANKRGLPERALMRHDSHYVDELTKRSGRSIGTMLALSMGEANPDRIRVMCREAGISNKSVLVQIARAGTEEEMQEMVRAFAAGEISREALRKQTASRPEPKKAGRPKNYVFEVKDKSLPFSLNL